MDKTKKISLNSSDISKTIKELKQMKSELGKATDKAVEEIMQEAVEFCKRETGNFEANTYYVKTSNGYRLVQEGYGVIYVEFGTGVVGLAHEQHPYQGKVMGIVPQNSIQGHKFIAPDGREAWYYPKGDGTFGITSGQPARMQMYKTAKFLEERLGEKVKFYVEGVVKKW